jgi:hypothetical protein
LGGALKYNADVGLSYIIIRIHHPIIIPIEMDEIGFE